MSNRKYKLLLKEGDSRMSDNDETVSFDSGWESVAREAYKKHFEEKLNSGENITEEDKRTAEMYGLNLNTATKTVSFKNP